MDTLTPAGSLLVFGVLPLWLLAGFLDWTCHRRTGIAVTSGLKENAFHWLMFLESLAGVAVLVAFQVDAAVLAIVAGLILVHELTIYVELRSSTLERDVGPAEQMIHSFQELLPLAALALLAVDAWPQALAAVHRGDAAADWSLRARESLPLDIVVAFALVALFLNVLPLVQETASCALAGRAARRTRADRRSNARVEPKLDPAGGGDPVKARTPASPEPR